MMTEERVMGVLNMSSEEWEALPDRVRASAATVVAVLEAASEQLNDMGCEHETTSDGLKNSCLVCMVDAALAPVVPWEPEAQKPLVFGDDIYHHGEGCNGAFILRVKCSMRGVAFSPDGYSYDDLDVDEDESRLFCDECGYEVEFAEWQEAANVKIEQEGGRP